MVRFDVRKIS
jgi:hypothetical protein